MPAAHDHLYVNEPVLVLKKSDYSESSVIIAALTVHFGQVHFLVKGGRKPAKRLHTGIDLCQHLSIGFKAKWTVELQTAHQVDLIRSYHAIAENYHHYTLAAWSARFILANTQPNNPTPVLFQAMDHAFMRWSLPDTRVGIAVVIGLLFIALEELGYLAAFVGQKELQHEIGRLRDYSLNLDALVPNYTLIDWRKLGLWLKDYIHHYTNLKLPSGFTELLFDMEDNNN